MGVVTGSIRVETSEEDLAYSEDPDVVAGERREGCGWCPVTEFERVGDGADVATVRSLNERERTHYRDLYARIGEATANVYVVKTAVRVVTTRVGGKAKRLEAAKATEWVSAVARTNPAALDLLATRIICRTNGRNPDETYPDTRRVLGYPALEEVGSADDGEPKSVGAS